MKIKEKYNVYAVEFTDDGEGTTSTREIYVGQTYAVSAAKACCNIAHRCSDNRIWDDIPWACDGHRGWHYEAYTDFEDSMRKMDKYIEERREMQRENLR